MTKPKPKIRLPYPGPNRFWHNSHNPNSVKFPMTLELRESSIDIEGRDPKVGFSKVIAKQPVIADSKSIQDAANDILTRAGRVDEFKGILPHEEAA